MKIGSWTIGRSGIFKEKALDIDTVPMFNVPSRTEYKLKGINTYYSLYKDHDLVRGMIDDLAESACGQGIFTTVEKLSPVFQKNRSKELCDEFGKQVNLDEVLPKVAKNTLIAGYCPVETKLSSDIEKCSLKLVHPQTIEKIVTDPVTGEVLEAHQKVNDKKMVLSGKDLAWFTYGNLANDPRGISFIHSILSLLTTLDNATNTVSKIAERYISPIAIWKSRASSEKLKAAVKTREEGDAIFLGSQTPDEMKEETVKFYQVDPRVPFWDYMENLELRVYAYSRASNVWYTKNANLASAEKMEDIVARHVASIQRNIKRTIEKVWFTPLCVGLEEVPKVNFGREPTGVEDITPSDIITKGLELGYINQAQFYEICRQIGIKITEGLGKEEEKPEENEEEEEEELKPEEKERIEALIKELKESKAEVNITLADLREVVLKHAEEIASLSQLKKARLLEFNREREYFEKLKAQLKKEKV